MAFTILNEADAAFPSQAEPFSADIDAIIKGFRLPHGVQADGCAVTDGAGAMDVNVAVGVARIEGRRVSVTAGDVTISAADGTNPRIDLITVDTAGTKAVVAGTPAANPVMPAIPANRVLLATVYVPANDTTIETNQITDKRISVYRPIAELPRWYGAVADGTTDDSTAINNACTAAGQAGGTGLVLMRRATYAIGTMVTVPSGVTLEGAGIDKTVIRGLAGLVTGVISAGAPDVIVRGMTVDGNAATVTSTTVDGIRIGTNGDKVKIIDVEIVNTPRSAVWVSSADEVDLVRVTCRNCQVDAASQGVIHVLTSTGVIIDHPRILNWGPGNIRGIHLLTGSHDAQIIAPFIRQTADQQMGHGISIDASHRCVVSDVNIDLTGYTGTARTGMGISVFNATDTIVKGGVIRMPTGTDSSLEPIATDGTSARTGISDLNVSGGDDQGITAWSPETRVEGCHVDNAWSAGISVNAANCTVVNNVCKNNGRGGGADDAGIQLRASATDCSVTGNACFDDQGGSATQKYGIMEQSGADRNLVMGNNCHSNVTAQLLRSGAASRFIHNIGGTQEPGELIKVTFSAAGALVTGTGVFRWYNDTGRTLTFLSTRGSVGTQPTGTSILVDVNIGGTSIWNATQANRITIAVSTNTAEGGTPDTTTIADGSYLTVDIDQIGSGTAGADLTVTVVMFAKD